jgi:hypothetical protein
MRATLSKLIRILDEQEMKRETMIRGQSITAIDVLLNEQAVYLQGLPVSELRILFIDSMALSTVFLHH